MDDRRFNVLFLGTRNAVRSVMAEALTNSLCAPRFIAFSAGSRPTGVVHPLALQALRHWGIPTAGLCSKSIDELLASGLPPLDFVITVCDYSRGEDRPDCPGRPVTAHWDLTDPVAAEADDEQHTFHAFSDVVVQLRRHVELLEALPQASLERMSLRRDAGPAQDTANDRA